MSLKKSIETRPDQTSDQTECSYHLSAFPALLMATKMQLWEEGQSFVSRMQEFQLQGTTRVYPI